MIRTKKIANEIVRAIEKASETNSWFSCEATIEEIEGYSVVTNSSFDEVTYGAIRTIADYFELIYDVKIYISTRDDSIYLW